MVKELLGQRYRLIDRIGEGGMAYVYLALDEKLGRKVAVKVLHSHMEKNPDIRRRFQLEAQAISSLDHPNIVKIYDFSGDQSEKLWIVTEVITGSNLADYLSLQKENRLHVIIGTCIVREITKALAKAHSQKIVHRDIKPENVMLTIDGRVKLMDFGIAKDMQHTGMTMTGTFMGSPSYMSPEQIRGKDVDFKTDIYSVSVLFYEILTGKLPFVGKTTHDVVLRIMEGIFTFPRYIVPNILPEIDLEIIRGMSMDPGKRHESIAQLGAALDYTLKKAGFDESHIELERYTKNPQEYLKSIGQRKKSIETPISQAQSPATTHRRRRKTDYHLIQNPQTRNTTSSEQEKTHLISEQRMYSPRPPQKSAQAHPPAPTLPHTDQRPIKAPKKTALKDTVKIKQNTKRAAEQPGDRDLTKESLPKDQVHESVFGKKTEVVAEQDFFQHKMPQRHPLIPAPPPPIARPVQQDVPQPVRYPPQRPVAPRRPNLAQMKSYKPAFLPYFFGFAWVGLILFLSSWGFLELNKYLSIHSQKNQSNQGINIADKRTKSGSKDSKAKQESESPVDIFKRPLAALPQPLPSPLPTNPPKSNKPEIRNKKPDKIAEKNSSLDTTSESNKQKSSSKMQKTRLIKQLPPQEKGGLSIETNIIRQKRHKKIQLTKSLPPAKTASNQKPSTDTSQDPSSEKKPIQPPSPVPLTKEDVPSEESPTDKQQGLGKGKIQVSSQPAAEVFIDDTKVGNTNDATSSSGWIVLPPGEHTLELKRQGYATHKMTFDVGEDAQLIIPKIELKPASSQPLETPLERRPNFSLTVKVSHIPSTLHIRNLETNHLQTFVIKSYTRVIYLEQSRYQLRMEYAGQVRERTFNTKQTQGNYTFFAEF